MEPAELDEERRLAYVAITRARKKLTITYTNERLLYGRTGHNPRSRFVDEIPSSCIQMEDNMPKREQHYVFGSQVSPKPAYGVRTGYSGTPYGGGAKQIPKVKAFNVGDRVSHLTFGAGTISAVTPMGGDVLYDVEFDAAGHKRLMGSYARLTALN